MGEPRDQHRKKPAGPPIQIGDVLADKYVVERLLGVGGMGVVVAARHRELNELRAIKLLRGEATTDKEAVERFLREARAAVRLKSEHAVKIHDVGRLADGEPYMVMEHLDGMDLKAMLRQRGPLPPAETVALVVQAVEAIAEAHAAGIVHRDLKPGNLFVTTGLDGQPFVKVLDFGISKLTGAMAAGEGMDMTKTSSMLGTPYYMSPEQMRSSREVDARTDVWALGVILYQLVTGRVPFKASSITALCASVLQDEPVGPRQLRADLPPAFEEVVLRCLLKDPAARYATVGELATALVPFGPPEVQASAARVVRLLSRAVVPGVPSLPSMPSAVASGDFVAQRATPGPITELEPATTPLSQNRPWPDPSATAASWGRTGGFDRGKLSPRLKVALVLVASAIGLVALLLVVTLGSSSESTTAAGQGGAVPSPALPSGAGGGAEVAFGSQGAVVEDHAGGAGGRGGGAAKDGGGKKSKTSGGGRRARPVRPRPTATKTKKPSSDDPFGEGRK